MENDENDLDSTLNVRFSRLRTALVIGLLSALGPLSVETYLPSLPIMTRDLATSASLAQLSITTFLLGLAVGQLFAGPLSDAHGRRIPIMIATVGYAVMSLLCAAAPSIWALILFRFIQGMAGAAAIVIARACVRDLYSGTELTKFFSLMMLFYGFVPILAPIAGGQLLLIGSWRSIFVVLSILAMAMFFTVIFSLPETLPRQRRLTGGIKNTFYTFRNLLGDRIFMAYTVSLGLVTAAMFAYLSGSSFVLQDIYGISAQAFSVIVAINGFGMMIGVQVTGRLAGQISEAKLFQAGLALATVSGLGLLVFILVRAGLPAVMAAFFLIVASTGIVYTAGFSLAMQNQGENAGSASALIGLSQFVFGAIVAPLVGLRGNQTALPMGIVIAICVIGAIACYILLIKPGKKHASFITEPPTNSL